MRSLFLKPWVAVALLNAILPILVSVILRSIKYSHPEAGGTISVIWLGFGVCLLLANVLLGRHTGFRAYFVFGALNVVSFAILGEVSVITGIYAAYFVMFSLL